MCVCQQVEGKEHVAFFSFGFTDCLECCLNIMHNSHCISFTVICFKFLCFVVLPSNEQIQNTFVVICMTVIQELCWLFIVTIQGLVSSAKE